MKPLDWSDFEALLDRHGADWLRWPEAERQRAQAFIAGSERAQRAFREAARLEALLALPPNIEPAPGLSERIVRAARTELRPARGWWPFQKPLAPLMAWAGALLLGLWVGSGPAKEWDRDNAEASSEAAADVELDDEWAELSELSLAAEWALQDEP